MPGLAGEVANLVVALKLDDSGFRGKLNNAARQLNQMDRGFSQIGRGVGQIGTGLDRLATRGAVAAVGGLTAVITTAASMEEAFIGVQKTVDETAGTSFEELRQAIRTMSSETGFAFEELARIGEAGGALGIPIEDLDTFIDVISRLGVSTNLSTDQAATAMGQLRTILQLSEEDMVATADALVALGNAGSSTEDQIVEMAARFAAAGNSAGLSNEQILALSSAVASMGIEVEAGGSSLSRLFNNTTTAIGTASEEAVAFADALGLTFEDFKRAWDQDAFGTFEDLQEHLNQLDQFGQASLLKDLGITNTRDISAIQLMAQNYGFLAEQVDIANDSVGSLNEESDKFLESGSQQFKRLWENLRLTADTIGTELLPITNELIGEFVTWLQEAEQQQAIKDFATDLAEGIRGFVDELRGADLDALISTFEGAANVAKTAFDVFMALPDPVKQLLLGGIIVNKATGGALGAIVGGLTNVFAGSLKTIMAGNVTVVGKTVTGPGFGPTTTPTTGPAGFAGLIPALITAVGGATIGITIGNALQEEIVTPARNFMDEQVAEILASNDPARIRAAIDAFEDEIAIWEEKPPQVRQALDGVIDQLEARRAALIAALGEDGGGGGGGGETSRRTRDERFQGLTQEQAQNFISSVEEVRSGVDMLPDTSMMAPGINALAQNLSPLRVAADNQLAQQRLLFGATLGVSLAVAGQSGLLSVIANKDFSPTLVVPVQVNFSATMYQQTVARQVTSRTGSGDATTGGI